VPFIETYSPASTLTMRLSSSLLTTMALIASPMANAQMPTVAPKMKGGTTTAPAMTPAMMGMPGETTAPAAAMVVGGTSSPTQKPKNNKNTEQPSAPPKGQAPMGGTSIPTGGGTSFPTGGDSTPMPVSMMMGMPGFTSNSTNTTAGPTSLGTATPVPTPVPTKAPTTKGGIGGLMASPTSAPVKAPVKAPVGPPESTSDGRSSMAVLGAVWMVAATGVVVLL
jgi:hypothetical protein